MHLRGSYLVWAAILLAAGGQEQAPPRNSSTMLAPIYKPGLSNLPQDPADFNPALGGQNFGICCRLVINESLVVEDDELRIRPGQTVFRGTIEGLEQFPRFPCGATYNGTLNGPPQEFWVHYTWCSRRCGGWGVTQVTNVARWLKPFIAFILPSLVFCLIVPRRWHLSLPRWIFSRRSLSVLQVLSFTIKIPLASLVVLLDTLLWLAVVFSLAGPIMASSIYEALLDIKLMSFLKRRIKANELAVRERAHAALVILIGNLDDSAWVSSAMFVQRLPPNPVRKVSQSGVGLQEPRSKAPEKPSASGAPPSRPGGGVVAPAHVPRDWYGADQPRINVVKSKLRSLLESQYSFGAYAGAPIIFYIAAFIWSVYEVHEDLGVSLTAHQLAFGMFWTTIPHVALVSCLSLAGNNPSLWYGVAADYEAHLTKQVPVSATRPPTGAVATRSSKPTARLFDLLRTAYAPVAKTEDQYRAAWVWNRGPNKARWIAQLTKEYPALRSLRGEVLGRRFGMSLWISGIVALVLVFVPVFFGALVSYQTPQVGFSCRSLTMLVYAASQVILVVVWLLDWALWKRRPDGEVRTLDDGDDDGNKISASTVLRWNNYMWYLCFMIGASLGLFTSVGGTVFILIGLFTNCLCFIQARFWWDRNTNPDALAFFGSATREQLYYANAWWFPAGIVGAVFLVVVAYVGWWYQRSLRLQFSDLVSRLDYVDEQIADDAAKPGVPDASNPGDIILETLEHRDGQMRQDTPKPGVPDAVKPGVPDAAKPADATLGGLNGKRR
ncbi:hypothetical protein QBC39DRAFT_81494 [Podospora conica]|nr:hypothetical protein QBC39DRAFT_81494 [Schizothecium conicum]